MSNQDFHGGFVFRYQGYGILSSTYFNTGKTPPYPETAILKSKKKEDNFVGTFETTWLEPDGHYNIRLVIEVNNLGMYDLEWMHENTLDKPQYKGLGIIENGILVGCYWFV